MGSPDSRRVFRIRPTALKIRGSQSSAIVHRGLGRSGHDVRVGHRCDTADVQCSTPATTAAGDRVITFSLVVAGAAIASCVAAFFICQAILATNNAGVLIIDPGVLRAVLGAAVHLVLIGAIAVGLGSALRKTTGAVAVLFAVLLVIPDW